VDNLLSVVSSECLRNGCPDEKLEQKNTWSCCALLLLELHELMIFMRINFKKLNFGQLILMKIIETAATRQHIFEATMHQIGFQLGAPPRKTLVRPPCTSVAWTTDRPTDMLVHL